MFIRCRYTVSSLHMLNTQEKAVCCCCLMHVFMQRSKEKQLEANVFAFGWGEQWWNYFEWRFIDAMYDSLKMKIWKCRGLFWGEQCQEIKERPVWSWRLLCVFSSLMDLKDALGQLAAFSVGHLVLLFVPFLFFLVHIQHKAVLHKQRGSWFNLKVVDDEHSNFLFCFRTRRDGFSGFHSIFLFLFLATVI